jgi:hypothetical protein
MGVRFITLQEQATMPLHKLDARTYLDAKGKATTDEAKAVSLLGIEGDEISAEQAFSAGLIKDEPKPGEVSGPKMLYYDANGKRVSEAAPGGTQFLDNDPTRPDAPKPEVAPAVGEAGDGSDYSKLKKADLMALANQRGVEVAADAKVADIRAALEAADQKE